MTRTIKQLEVEIERLKRDAENQTLSKYQRAMAYGELRRLSLALTLGRPSNKRKKRGNTMTDDKPHAAASNALLAEKCDDLAKKLADKIMRYLGKQVCLDEEITIGDIEALISNDLMVILTANTAGQTPAAHKETP